MLLVLKMYCCYAAVQCLVRKTKQKQVRYRLCIRTSASYRETKGRITTHLEFTVELAVLGIHRLCAQLVHTSVQRYPEVIGEALAQVLKNRYQR